MINGVKTRLMHFSKITFVEQCDWCRRTNLVAIVDIINMGVVVAHVRERIIARVAFEIRSIRLVHTYVAFQTR